MAIVIGEKEFMDSKVKLSRSSKKRIQKIQKNSRHWIYDINPETSDNSLIIDVTKDERVVTRYYDKNVKLLSENDYYEYLYLVMVIFPLGNIKYYLGYSTKKIAEIYWGTNKENYEYNKEKSDPNNKVVKIILNVGVDKESMHNEERKILNEVEPIKNPLWYNKSEGGGKGIVPIVNGIVSDLIKVRDVILDGGYELVTLSMAEIRQFEPHQVRPEGIDYNHKEELKAQMEKNSGNLSKWTPIPVLKDFRGPGKHSYIGNCHSIEGAFELGITHAPVQFIPKEVWKQFTDSQLETLSSMMNPNDPKPSKPNSPAVIGERLFKMYIDEVKDNSGWKNQTKNKQFEEQRNEFITWLKIQENLIYDLWNIVNFTDTMKNEAIECLVRWQLRKKDQVWCDYDQPSESNPSRGADRYKLIKDQKLRITQGEDYKIYRAGVDFLPKSTGLDHFFVCIETLSISFNFSSSNFNLQRIFETGWIEEAVLFIMKKSDWKVEHALEDPTQKIKLYIYIHHRSSKIESRWKAYSEEVDDALQRAATKFHDTKCSVWMNYYFEVMPTTKPRTDSLERKEEAA